MPDTLNHIPQRAHGQQLQRCPLCGHAAGMWEVQNSRGTFKAVTCDREGFAEGPLGEVPECPLSLPGSGFTQSTYREAAGFWNRFADACTQSRADMKFRTAA